MLSQRGRAMVNFNIIGTQIWAQIAQTRENFEFLVNFFSANGQIPMSNFYKIRCGGVPGPNPHAKVNGCGFKMWAYRR